MTFSLDRYLRVFSALVLALALIIPSLSPSALARENGEDNDNDVEPYKFEPIVKPANFPDPFILEFDAVPDAMKKGSPILLSTKANREVLFYNRNQLADQQRTINGSATSLMNAMSGVSQMRSGLDAAFAASGQVSAADMLLKSAVDAQLAMTQSQLASQVASAATADKGYAAGGEMSASIDQMDDAALQVTYSALALYQGYWTVERQIQRAEEELILLQRQLNIAILLEEMGRATAQYVKTLSDGIAAMEHGLTVARLEQKNLLDELNLMLGRPIDSTLILQPLPAPDLEVFRNLDYDSAWKAVYKESYALKAKKHAQGGYQEQYDDAKKYFGEYGDRAWRAEQQLEGAKLNAAMTAEQIQTRFEKLYEKMGQMVISYELELEKLATIEATLKRTEQRYDLGYIAESELLTVRNNLSAQKAVVAQAEDDMALTWQRWLLVQKGMDLSVGEK